MSEDELYYHKFSATMYAQCFKKVFPQFNQEIGEDHQNQMDQCLNNFVKSYQTIGGSWVKYTANMPDKDRYGPPKLDL